jgi:hypothetical protein
MTIDDLHKQWSEDSRIDENNITKAAIEIPKLHAKYYRYYIDENLKLRKLKSDLNDLLQLKRQWYRGELSREELTELGWSQQPLKVLRSDIEQYVMAEKDVIAKTLRVGLQEELAAFLESIVKQINTRNFILKTIVDYERFKTGG